MALNNFDEDQFDQENIGGDEFEPEPPKRRSNRNFLIAIAIIGVIFLIALVLLLLVAPGILSNQRAAQQEQAAQINANNTATAMWLTAAAQQQATKTPTRTVVATSVVVTGPTKTPVVVILKNTPVAAQGGSGTGLSASELATVSALQTIVAGRGAGTPAPTSTTLPSTGFADQVGLPMVAGLAIVLVAVIILSRRLRLNSR
jgi:LPXTG-motif cell wall-anchored protein